MAENLANSSDNLFRAIGLVRRDQFVADLAFKIGTSQRGYGRQKVIDSHPQSDPILLGNP